MNEREGEVEPSRAESKNSRQKRGRQSLAKVIDLADKLSTFDASLIRHQHLRVLNQLLFFFFLYLVFYT